MREMATTTHKSKQGALNNLTPELSPSYYQELDGYAIEGRRHTSASIAMRISKDTVRNGDNSGDKRKHGKAIIEPERVESLVA
jgi:hypothetical protein